MIIRRLFGGDLYMLILITYDVSRDDGGEKRLRKIAKICEKYGQRVQNSTFECLVNPQQLVVLKNDLLKNFNENYDSIRIYYLGSNWKRRVEHFGIKEGYDPEGPLVF